MKIYDFKIIEVQCPYIKFYWNTTVLIHLHISYGYFCAIVAEQNSCNRDQKACKA